MKIDGYHYQIEYSLKDNTIFVEGVVMKEYKKLQFSSGTRVSSKFNQKNMEGVIVKITSTKVHLQLDNGKTKSVSHEELVQQNVYTSTILRLENSEGFGPYQSKNPSIALLNWRKEKNEQYKKELEEGRTSHPAPMADSYLSEYYDLTPKATFGFNDYAQLNNWFSKEDLALLEAEGFSVIYKQKGRDFYESFYSSHQIAMLKTQEDYEAVFRSKNHSYYY